MEHNRVLRLEHGINFRELGGYENTAGQTIKWQKLLDEVGKSVLERLLDNNSEVERFQVKESFKYGFRLGMQLAAAGLDSKDQL